MLYMGKIKNKKFFVTTSFGYRYMRKAICENSCHKKFLASHFAHIYYLCRLSVIPFYKILYICYIIYIIYIIYI